MTWKCYKRRTRILSFGMQQNVLVSFLVLKNHLYPRDLNRSSSPKKKRFIIAQTIRTSVLFAIRLKVVLKAGPQTKSTKKVSSYSLLRKLIPGINTGRKKTPSKTGLPSKIFWIDFWEIVSIGSILHGLIGCKPKNRPISQTIRSSDDSTSSKHRLRMKPTILLR